MDVIELAEKAWGAIGGQNPYNVANERAAVGSEINVVTVLLVYPRPSLSLIWSAREPVHAIFRVENFLCAYV